MSFSKHLNGIGVSPGIAIGEAFVLDAQRSRLPFYRLPPEQVDREIKRLNAAIAAAKAELESIRKIAAPRLGENHLYILDVGILLLGDDMLIGEARKQIQSQRTNAEWAVQAAINHFTRTFGSTPTNAALAMLNHRGVEVVTGVNLPMLLKVPFLKGKTTSEAANFLVEYGRRNLAQPSEMLQGMKRRSGGGDRNEKD